MAGDTELQQLVKIGQSGGRNPIQETRYQELLKQAPGQANGISSTDPIAQAQRVRDFTIQSNQPAIQSYEASKQPLQDRYKNLLDTIKGNQQVAENRQTVTTNNELARRGISNDSGVFQQEMTNVLNPLTAQYTGMQKDTLANQNIDMAAIDKAIAMLKTGNPENAISGGLQIGNQLQQAEQSANQLQLQQQQLQEQSKQSAMANALQQLQFDTESGYKKQTFPLELALLQAQVNKANRPAGGGGASLESLAAQLGF